MSNNSILTRHKGYLCAIKLRIIFEIICLCNDCASFVLHFNAKFLRIVVNRSTSAGVFLRRGVGLNAELEVAYLGVRQLFCIAGAGKYSQRKGEDG